MIDIAIIGAGAAGLTAAIFAAERAVPLGQRVVVLESARKPGAKILISGGGRCNVTNETVSPDDFCGGSRATIRKVLAEFNAHSTRQWFSDLGVELMAEPGGKLFPATGRARTVLDALLKRVTSLGAELWTDALVAALTPQDGHFTLLLKSHSGKQSAIDVRRVVVAAGGLALPKSGSDGTVMQLLKRLGHSIVPTTPALVPLVVQAGPGLGGSLMQFSGVSVDGHIRLYGFETNDHRKLVREVKGSILFTHFGLSGPAPMNLSRHFLREQRDSSQRSSLVTLGLGRFSKPAEAEQWISEYVRDHPRQSVASMLSTVVPARLASAIADSCAVDCNLGSLTREMRSAIGVTLSDLPVHIAGTRGYSKAEATAGGIDLREIDVRTMHSRVIDGLYLCGEILDVDGRIGGFNFQWAWSSGYLAGRGAAS